MQSVALRPLPPSEWSPDHARHLLNRAGFGVPEERVEHLAALGPREAVRELVHYQRVPDPFHEPDFLPNQSDYREFRQARKSADEEERRKLQREFQARQRIAVEELQAWWFERLVATPRPLEEKMTLFWHGHFATSAQKVRVPAFNYRLNQIFRTNAVGNIKALTFEVGQSPSMLRYLDNVQNVKEHPNENWARELMELFTLGVGNYTEDDIKESARAFTGWTLDEFRFAYDPRKHDFGTKTFLGRTGNFDGWDIIDIIFEQPRAAEFFAEKLWRFFAYDQPEPEIVAGLAGILREHQYDLAPMLEELFLSRAFYSQQAMGTQIKSPVQLLVQLAHHLELDPPPYLGMARASGRLGQRIFYPPNVAGWEGGRAWINANTLLTRYNMTKSLVVAEIVEPDEATMMDMGAMRQEGKRRYHEEFRQALGEMPLAERRATQAKMKSATTRIERRKILENTIFETRSDEVWDVRDVFTRIEFATVGECVDGLASRYLSTTLNSQQRGVLASALSPGESFSARLSPETLTRDQMTSAMHLLFSLAEYQLC